MNEQIRTLALQAGMNKMNQRSDGFFVVDEKVFEKFAELIVKECIQVAGDNAVSLTETPDPNIGMAKLEVVRVIIRHFGVES